MGNCITESGSEIDLTNKIVESLVDPNTEHTLNGKTKGGPITGATVGTAANYPRQ